MGDYSMCEPKFWLAAKRPLSPIACEVGFSRRPSGVLYGVRVNPGKGARDPLKGSRPKLHWVQDVDTEQLCAIPWWDRFHKSSRFAGGQVGLMEGPLSFLLAELGDRGSSRTTHSQDVLPRTAGVKGGVRGGDENNLATLGRILSFREYLAHIPARLWVPATSIPSYMTRITLGLIHHSGCVICH